MQEIYITITKTAAPAGTGNGCKNTSTHENVGTPIVRRKKRRVNLRPMTAALAHGAAQCADLGAHRLL